MRSLLITYLFITILLIMDTTLFLVEGISLPGQLPDWLLFWTWFVMTYLVVTSNFHQWWRKFYVNFLIIFIVLTMIPMMIPFIMILSFASTPMERHYRISDDIELREFFRSPVAQPTIAKIKSFGLYEKIVGETRNEFQLGDDSFRMEDVKSVRKLYNVNNDSLKVEFVFENGTVVRTF